MAYNNINSQNIYNNNNQNLNKGIYASHSMDDYEKLDEIGTGQFSTVYKVRYKKTGDIFAMKKIKKRPPNETEEQKNKLEGKLKIWKSVIIGKIIIIQLNYLIILYIKINIF